MLRERARDVDGFVVNSRWYGEMMADYLGVPGKGCTSSPSGCRFPAMASRSRIPRTHRSPWGTSPASAPKRGSMCWWTPSASSRPSAPGRCACAWPGIWASGTGKFLEEQEAKIRSWGLADAYEYAGEIDREAKIRFIRSLDVLSVPTVYREPKGLFVLEALANGVPVVEPRHGAFPEVIEATGGGLLVEPGSPEALARGIGELLDDPAQREELGRRGREAVLARFSDGAEAVNALAVYRQLLAGRVAA